MQQCEPANLDSIFRRVAAQQPDRPAVLGPASDAVVTYAQLDLEVANVARQLARAGVTPGSSLGLNCPSGKDYIVMTYAAWRLGACVVPIPVELVDSEKRQIVATIKLDAVLAPDAGAAFLTPFRCGSAAAVAPGTALVPVRSPRAHPPGFDALNAAMIRFTSGTTARSKGVVLSHRTIVERVEAANAVLEIGPQDRVMWLLSMSYHFAVSIAGYLSLGAAIVLPRNHLATEVLAAAGTHAATLIYAAPTHITWLADAPGTYALDQLRLAVSTTAPLAAAVGRRFQQRFGAPVAQALGIIEVGLPFINVAYAAQRGDAVGCVLPAYRLKLAECGFGARFQEVLLSGPGCLDAYYDPWLPRATVLADGWFHTGDVGEVDSDGCLFLRGRTKDVINVMGMKFFPQEVEAILASHPQVAEACVRSDPDQRFGEAPFARVVLKKGGAQTSDQTLMDYCQERMASYKVPARIEFVNALPKTASGKILHRGAPVTG